MAEQITQLPPESTPLPDQIETGEIARQIDEERAHRYGDTLLRGMQAGEDLIVSPTDIPAKSPHQIAAENETSWMIKDMGEQKPDAYAVKAQTDEAWDLHEGRKAKKQVEEEKEARLQAEQEVEEHIKESMLDKLTGLPNREGFLHDADTMFANNREGFVLAFADLDGFKAINDKLGHRVGDEVLKEVADKLRARIIESGAGTVGRFGGDEFVIALNNVLEQDQADQILSSVEQDIKSISKTSESGDITLNAGVSIGRVYGSEIENVEHDGLGRADKLMYEVKQANRPEGYQGR